MYSSSILSKTINLTHSISRLLSILSKFYIIEDYKFNPFNFKAIIEDYKFNPFNSTNNPRREKQSSPFYRVGN
jgi:hypothetical protein